MGDAEEKLVRDAYNEVGTGDVATAMALAQAAQNPQLCAAGHHAWVPWLLLESGSWVTWCGRPGCNHHEQYDTPAAAGSPETGEQ